MPANIDNGIYERDDLDWFHFCESCHESFETTRAIPPEDGRFCGECYLWAADVVQKWWREMLDYKKRHCYECGVKSTSGYFSCRLGTEGLCDKCYNTYYKN